MISVTQYVSECRQHRLREPGTMEDIDLGYWWTAELPYTLQDLFKDRWPLAKRQCIQLDLSVLVDVIVLVSLL